jgi:hypothetical protein
MLMPSELKNEQLSDPTRLPHLITRTGLLKLARFKIRFIVQTPKRAEDLIDCGCMTPKSLA